MTQADMQLCCVEGEVETCLLQETLLAKVWVEVAAAAAALERNKHRSLVDAINLSLT